MNFQKTFVFFYALLLSTTLISQGSYQPSNADFTFPRTLLDASAIESIRTSLHDSLKTTIYSHIWERAIFTHPDDNSSNDSRKQRAIVAREAAFVLLMNSKYENENIITLPTDEKITLQNKVLDLLNNINPVVTYDEGWLFFDTWQFRSKELIHYLIAYDLLKATGLENTLLDEAKILLQQFAGNLHARVVDDYINPLTGIKNLKFFIYNPNNHGLMNASALGLAAIVLNDVESANPNYQPIHWINTAMWNLDYVLWEADGLIPRVGEREVLAGYAEGPNYFDYGFQNVFPFLRAMWNFLPEGDMTFTYEGDTKMIQHPWYDANYHRLYEWMMRIRMPNGFYPTIHDSSTNFRTALTALAGNSDYNIPNENIHYESIWVAAQYLSTNVPFGERTDPLFQALPIAGSLIFRSAWDDPTGLYVHLIGKHGIALRGAKAHHQADATSFQLYYQNEVLAFDEGYSGSDYRNYVNKAQDHNLILVNGKGPGVPVGEWPALDNTVFIENFFDTPLLDYGELHAWWEETTIKRKVLFPDHRFVVMIDEVRSDQVNDYQYQFHGNGQTDVASTSEQGVFELNAAEQNCMVSRGNVHLLTKVIAPGDADEYTTELDSIFNGTTLRTHSKMLVHKNGVKETAFLSILYPYTDEETEPLVEELPIDPEISALKLTVDTAIHLTLVQANPKLVAFTSALTNWPKLIRANGVSQYFGLDNTAFPRSVFLGEGDTVLLDNEIYLQASQKMDVAFQQLENEQFAGYVSHAGWLKVKSAASLVALSGSIESINYDPIEKINTIYFNEATHFTLEYGLNTDVPFGSLAEEQIVQIQLTPNPCIDQFTIQMDGITESETIIIEFADMNGRLLKTQKRQINSTTRALDLNVSDFVAGTYLLNLSGESFWQSYKIVVKNGDQ